MNSGIRIIKRGPAVELPCHEEKTVRQSDREIACTVKNWIAEFSQRKRRMATQGLPYNYPAEILPIRINL